MNSEVGGASTLVMSASAFHVTRTDVFSYSYILYMTVGGSHSQLSSGYFIIHGVILSLKDHAIGYVLLAPSMQFDVCLHPL